MTGTESKAMEIGMTSEQVCELTTITLCAASLDECTKLCIAACPYLDLKPTPANMPQLLAKCMKDRES